MIGLMVVVLMSYLACGECGYSSFESWFCSEE